MTNDREHTGDWNRTDWVGEGQADPEDARTTPDARVDADADARVPEARVAGETPEPGDRWNKTQWVGDQGDGAPTPEDPDLMPEGEPGLSGDRHTPGEQRWSQGQERDLPEPVGDRPLDGS